MREHILESIYLYVYRRAANRGHPPLPDRKPDRKPGCLVGLELPDVRIVDNYMKVKIRLNSLNVLQSQRVYKWGLFKRVSRCASVKQIIIVIVGSIEIFDVLYLA